MFFSWIECFKTDFFRMFMHTISSKKLMFCFGPKSSITKEAIFLEGPKGHFVWTRSKLSSDRRLVTAVYGNYITSISCTNTVFFTKSIIQITCITFCFVLVKVYSYSYCLHLLENTYRLHVVIIEKCRILKVNSVAGKLLTVFAISDGGSKIKTGFYVVKNSHWYVFSFW